MENKFNYYFIGHNFEYEARNALRVFDLNIPYEVKHISEFEFDYGLCLISSLQENNGKYVGSAKLYNNKKLLFESVYSDNEIVIEKCDLKKLKRNLVVKTIHFCLKNYYKMSPDYGMLTGVRPVKILFTALNNNKTIEEINDILKNTYEVKEHKIKLMWDVLRIEKKYINEKINKQNYNLYIGIPFCPSKCSYCSFTSYVDQKESKVNSYINTLIYEIEKTIILAKNKNLNLNSIYIGGGTPSFLNIEEINKIFDVLKKYYDLSKINEISFEAGRPDTITKEKLICLKENFVSRISINPQTMNDETLKIIGREHSTDDIIEKYYLAKEIGFNSINMDMILGLPGEDVIDAKNTIEQIVKLRPDNITVHALSYKRNSALTNESKQREMDYELLHPMQQLTHEICINESYMPYYMYRQKNIKGNLENIGYTLRGKESIYNIAIIEETETILGCGAGTSSKIMFEDNRHESIYNLKSLEEYIRRIDELILNKENLLNE